uniref:DUF1640 domain-containing protein n=1 Tax=Desulfacinum infernum TaxID=35837 RepID=A0A831ZJU2_9BACT
MTVLSQTDDALLEQKITAVVHQILAREVDGLVAEKIATFVKENELRARELSLMERVVRVEEELKSLREIEAARFDAVEKRFEALQREITARFEAVDKRFEALQREITARFEAVDKRFEAMDKRFQTLQWTMGIGFSLLAVLMGALKFWP